MQDAFDKRGGHGGVAGLGGKDIYKVEAQKIESKNAVEIEDPSTTVGGFFKTECSLLLQEG